MSISNYFDKFWYLRQIIQTLKKYIVDVLFFWTLLPTYEKSDFLNEKIC
jgi:hypothetical protein